MTRLQVLVGSFAALAALSPSDLRAQTVPTPLHVEVLGRGWITTVVLHGGPGMRHNYLRPEWDQLQDVGRVVYYDQRGCGKSVRQGPYTWQQHVQDLDDLLSSLGLPGPVVLAGSSWGSFLALLYAYIYPDKVAGLLLSGLAEGLWDDFEGRARRADELRWQNAVRGSRTEADLEGAGHRIDETAVRDSMTVARLGSTLIDQRAGEICIGVRSVTLDSFQNTAPLRDSLRSLQIPVLIFRGLAADRRGDAAEIFAAVLPHAQVVPIAAGHDPWLDRPDLFFAEAKRFIRGLAATAAR